MRKSSFGGLQVVCLSFVFAMAVTSSAVAQKKNHIFDSHTLAPFVPTPQAVVNEMLDLAAVSSGDVVYDLGSGDGRILITAVQDFKARAVGIEISKPLVEDTRSRLRSLGIDNRAKVIHQDMLDADLRGASVVTVYLMSSSNELLKPNLERDLKPGARIVSHDFQFEDWVAEATRVIDGGARKHTIYLYRMGKHRAEDNASTSERKTAR